MAREQRKVEAILAADAVGCSRHGGRLAKLTGDGGLVDLARAVDAPSAAAEALR